jgi:hypothetical protein
MSGTRRDSMSPREQDAEIRDCFQALRVAVEVAKDMVRERALELRRYMPMTVEIVGCSPQREDVGMMSSRSNTQAIDRSNAGDIAKHALEYQKHMKGFGIEVTMCDAVSHVMRPGYTPVRYEEPVDNKNPNNVAGRALEYQKKMKGYGIVVTTAEAVGHVLRHS